MTVGACGVYCTLQAVMEPHADEILATTEMGEAIELLQGVGARTDLTTFNATVARLLDGPLSAQRVVRTLRSSSTPCVAVEAQTGPPLPSVSHICTTCLKAGGRADYTSQSYSLRSCPVSSVQLANRSQVEQSALSAAVRLGGRAAFFSGLEANSMKRTSQRMSSRCATIASNSPLARGWRWGSEMRRVAVQPTSAWVGHCVRVACRRRCRRSRRCGWHGRARRRRSASRARS
jgi:hypothetical protein